MKELVIYFSRADENYGVGNIKVGNIEIIANEIAAKEIPGMDAYSIPFLYVYIASKVAIKKKELLPSSNKRKANNITTPIATKIAASVIFLVKSEVLIFISTFII